MKLNKINIITNENIIEELLNNNIFFKYIYIDINKKNNSNIKKIIDHILKKRINFKFKIKKELDKIYKKNKGIIAFVKKFEYSNLDIFLKTKIKKNSIFLILDHIEDPHNLGAIIRTACFSGINGIIIPNRRCVNINDTVIKVSMGAVFYIPIFLEKNISYVIKKLKKYNFWIYAADNNSNKNIFKLKFNNPLAMVFGNEGKGISKNIKKQCDQIVSIPGKGLINSLNVSVSAGIIIYKILMDFNA